jgi:mannose-6-phosphate isomerase-like protein (cupin superfamily)
MNKLYGFLAAISVSCAVLWLILPVGVGAAAEKSDARVTQIVHDVRVLPSKASARPATINETVTQGTGVRTGSDSRAELTFTDLSLTRLGANTVFSFDPGARTLNLTSGAALICVPPDAGSVRVIAPAVTAAISGGVAMAETHKDSFIKVIIIEGQGVVTIKKSGKSVTLHSGQMIVLPPGAKDFGKIHNINLKKLTDKSLLVKFAKLPKWVWLLMDAEIDRQASSPPSGGYVDPTGFDAIDQKLADSTPPPMKTPPRETPPPNRSLSGKPQ